MKIWRSKSGRMYYSENAEGLRSYTADTGSWVLGDTLPVDAVLIYDSNAQPDKVEVDPEEARIDAALQTIKERHSLCSDFDDAVDRAKNLSLLERLEFVAHEEGRSDLHIDLIKELNNPAYEPPAVPEKGDYVKVTYVNGDTAEGEVHQVIECKGSWFGGFTGFYVSDKWTVIPEPGSTYNESEPHNVADTIEVVKQPVKPVEIDGYWVKRREDVRYVAAWTNAECEGTPKVNSYTIEGAWVLIHLYSDKPTLRGYVPALLAIVKFFEQEEEAV